MEKLEEKSAQYVAENLNEILKEAFARVYEDGYRDGYYAAKDEEDVEVNKTEYVDLGLPSGTLWSNDFVRDGAEIDYMSFLKAKELNIPTESQWEELKRHCIFKIRKNGRYNTSYGECIGPNNNSIPFCLTEYKQSGDDLNPTPVFNSIFWLNNIGDRKNVARCADLWIHPKDKSYMQKFTMEISFNSHAPVRLVKSKK